MIEFLLAMGVAVSPFAALFAYGLYLRRRIVLAERLAASSVPASTQELEREVAILIQRFQQSHADKKQTVAVSAS